MIDLHLATLGMDVSTKQNLLLYLTLIDITWSELQRSILLLGVSDYLFKEPTIVCLITSSKNPQLLKSGLLNSTRSHSNYAGTLYSLCRVPEAHNMWP